MKIARFSTAAGAIQSGIVEGDTLLVIAGDAFGSPVKTGESLALGDVKLLAPVVPPNILCIGRNYADHAAELGNDLPKAPLLFIKASTSMNDPNGDVVLPRVAPHQVDYEAELAVVIGTEAKDVDEKDALRHVLGYTCANDVSARDAQMGDGQWARGKSFDTFCPLGPWIETEFNPTDVRVSGRRNGVVMQDARTSQLIFKVPHLISYLSRSLTLPPGTVILTGTPAGCGFGRKPPVWMQPGDIYEVEIEGIGTLRNRFVAAS
jgi:2-keto-4-pentenoate hydratase/2-oxohepta-3-ene-1,7-dioic acid hydratase in catechol pathway